MKTVKEISQLTGISVRTLHYYDEIGLLKPTEKSEAGYRLYDDKALEELQQVLFFREFDIPLKEIKSVMHSPDFDQRQVLHMHRNMLSAKRDRIARLIASIDDILKGENKMDFAVFSKTEVEAICQAAIDHMPDFMRQSIVEEFGGVEQWRQHYMEVAGKENMQRGYQKLVEWYGGKEGALNSFLNPPSQAVVCAQMHRIDAVLNKLLEKRGQPADSFAVKEVVGEYGFVIKQLYQLKQERGFMLAIAANYRDERVRAATQEKYGVGAADWFAQAIETFYGPM